MSRKGKMPILIPNGVEVQVTPEKVVVKGPKGELSQEYVSGMLFEIVDQQLFVKVAKEGTMSNFHGLYRSLVANMIQGVTSGFEKILELIGVGYRAAVAGNKLDLQLGFSQPIQLEIPNEISIKVEKNKEVTISGINKQQVGQVAATIRAYRPPEPYKGKGVRYKGEWVRRKAGKSGK